MRQAKLRVLLDKWLVGDVSGIVLGYVGKFEGLLVSRSEWQQTYSSTVVSNTQIATGHLDGTVLIHSLVGDAVVELENPFGPILKLCVLSNGYLATATRDRLCLWCLKTEKCFFGKKINATSLLALPNGLLACGLRSGNIEIWDLDVLVQSVVGHSQPVICMIAVGALFASCDHRNVRIWDENWHIVDSRHGTDIKTIVSMGDSIAAQVGNQVMRFYLEKNDVDVFPEKTSCLLFNGTLMSGHTDGTIRSTVTCVNHGEKVNQLLSIGDMIVSVSSFCVCVWE